MGCCFSLDEGEPGSNQARSMDHHQRAAHPAAPSTVFGAQGPVPLLDSPFNWKAKDAVTKQQIIQQREEFWATSPAYGGRQEIWDALRGACEAEDIALARAILDSAGVRLVDGTLRVAYDELGHRYDIPAFCIALPVNVIDMAAPVNTPSPTPQHVTVEPTPIESEATTRPDPSSPNAGPSSSSQLPPSKGEPTVLKMRISDGQDLTLDVGADDALGRVRGLLADQLQRPAATIMLMFMGKRLGDRIVLSNLGLRKNEMLQAMLLPKL